MKKLVLFLAAFFASNVYSADIELADPVSKNLATAFKDINTLEKLETFSEYHPNTVVFSHAYSYAERLKAIKNGDFSRSVDYIRVTRDTPWISPRDITILANSELSDDCSKFAMDVVDLGIQVGSTDSEISLSKRVIKAKKVGVLRSFVHVSLIPDFNQAQKNKDLSEMKRLMKKSETLMD